MAKNEISDDDGLCWLNQIGGYGKRCRDEQFMGDVGPNDALFWNHLSFIG